VAQNEKTHISQNLLNFVIKPFCGFFIIKTIIFQKNVYEGIQKLIAIVFELNYS
jgi:hypothetical protein